WRETVSMMSYFLYSLVLYLAVAVAADPGDDATAEIRSATIEEQERKVAEAAPAIQELDPADKQFYRWMFPYWNGSFDPVQMRKQHDIRLWEKIAAVNRVCGLTPAQKEKLDLAGRGDITRQFDRLADAAKTY